VPLQRELLVDVATDPEVTRSTVELVRKRPHEEDRRIADYRRGLVGQLIDYMINDRFGEISRRADAPFLSAGAGDESLSRTVDGFTFSARVPDGKIPDGLTALAIEAKRVRQYGFGAPEIDRAKAWMLAYMERAYNERDKTDSGSFAQEYISYFLQNEPSPGIAYEYRLVQQLLPGITAGDIAARVATLFSDNSRVLLAVSPQKAAVSVPTDAQLKSALASAEQVAVTPWNETTVTRDLVENKPAPTAVASRRELPALGITIVRFANGLEAWLKPTDFKNDQVVFDMMAPGGASLAPCADLPEATLATSYIGLAGVGGLKADDIERLLAGKIASASPYIGLSTQGISGSAAPAQLETALQLLYQDFVAPNDDPAAFALLTRQLSSAVANRLQSPQQVFADRLSEVNTSGHCTSTPLTPERVAALDRAKMMSFYRARFSNAADFTLFMVGAFKVDDAVPLLARYVGSLPSTGEPQSHVVDLGIHFPAANQRVEVVKGREPRASTVMSFFADPPPTALDQEYVGAATTVLDIALRDALREELGQTYTVGVGLSQPLPQRGAGRIQVQFGSAPENVASMIDRVVAEIKRLQANGPSADLTNRAKESARNTYQTSLRENGYWLRRLSSIHLLGLDPMDVVTRDARIDSITPQILQDVFKKDFPFDRYTIVTLMPERK
jgi:zinc protease